MIGWVAAAFALSACSAEGFRRFAFDAGQQYSCQQRNEGRRDEGIKDLSCMTDPAGKEGMSYDEYQQARSEVSR